MITYQVIIIIISLVFLMLVLLKEWIRPVMAFFLVCVALFLSGVIDAKDLLNGFSNEQLGVVLLLLLLSDVIRKTGILELGLKNLIKKDLSYRRFLIRIMVAGAGISAFVNNTPLVAITTPYVYDWGKRNKISPSKLLMPVTFAITLGGTITLIGTSTNVIVNGFITEAGLHPLNMFDFTAIGIPLALIGIFYLLFIGYKSLPDRKDALADFEKHSKDYLVETEVKSGSDLIGKTVEGAGLRNLRGLFLVEIIRKKEKITPAPPSEIIEEGDRLMFAGDTTTIIDLVNSKSNLGLPKFSSMLDQEHAEIVEVVVASDSVLIGKAVKEAEFRSRYDAAIIAIKRNGERISGKIGEVRLKAGDLLLLITGKDFYSHASETGDINLISKIREIRNYSPVKIAILIGATLIAFILPAIGILTLFKTLLLLMIVIGSMKIVKLGDIKRGFDVDLYMILALALAIGKAITNSGADKYFADKLISVLSPFHSNIALLAGVFIITNVFVLLINNRAAVAIAFPVALALATKLHLNPTPFFLAIAIAGSSTFMTPFCYQTNLMIYGPGGYKFKDYVRTGGGLTLLYFIVSITMLSLLYPLN
ncbi:SLC13 family permease [soil metagenome]